MDRSDPGLIDASAPACLRELPQWVCWRVEQRDGKPTKVPVCPGSSSRASSTDSSQWSSFNIAIEALEADAKIMGVGFVFTKDDPFCGIDLDDCRDESTGKILEWAQGIINDFGSYCEVSPSGTGVKIFIQGKKKSSRCRIKYESGEVEIYDTGRFFTVTGQWLSDDMAVVVDGQEKLDALCVKLFGKDTPASTKPPQEQAVHLSDDEIVKLVSSSKKKNEKFAALWRGDWNSSYNSASEADSSLIFKIAFYTKDPEQVDRVFRQSGMYREKWDELRGEQTYGQLTITRALAKVTGQYNSRRGMKSQPNPEEIDSIIAKGDVAHVFDRVDIFAKLDKIELGKLKARLKEKFGKSLNLRDLMAAVKEAKKTTRKKPKSSLPEIVLCGQLREKIDQCVTVLHEANSPPDLFLRGTMVSRIARDHKTNKHEIQSLSPKEAAALQERLTRVADFFREVGEGELCPCDPPRHLAEIVLGMRELPFPPIEGIVESPILREDGSILNTPGYDPATSLYFVPDEALDMPDVADVPARGDVDVALAVIDEALGDFPFICDASRANLLGLLLTVVMRPIIDGCVPLALIDAPTQGTGKGLLASVVNIITVGRDPVTMSAPGNDNDDEWRKRITANLLAGPPVIMLDNLVNQLDTPSLAAMLTARIWGDRKLGVSSNIEVPARAVWFATANNVSIKGDMTRRCYWIRLDAGVEQPWRRKGFKHPNLVNWVRANRGRLLHALLTIARYWFSQDKPSWSGDPLGSFESWCSVIGGTLECAGVEAFLRNSNRLYEEVDTESGEWASFFEEWHKRFGEDDVTTGSVAAEIMRQGHFTDAHSPLREMLPEVLVTAQDKGEGNLRKRLGIALRTHKDGVFGRFRLVRSGVTGRNKVATWSVQVLEENPGDPPSIETQARDLGLDPEAVSERAGILEFDAGMTRNDAEQKALEELLGIR